MLQPGQTIGPYTLVRALGRGAFGVVWLAERRTSLLTTQVALKIPLAGETDMASLRAEAQTWLNASGHPNIVPVLEAEVYDGQVVIASEYVAGGSLADCLRDRSGKAASLNEALSLMRGILTGLGHLHESGLIHRGLKPANVLLQKGIPRLTDFGLTRLRKADNRPFQIEGTPGYMAPECFQGDCSVAADIWSAGALFYELLCGSLPYPQRELQALLAAMLSGAEPAPMPDDVPEPLRSVILRALAVPPEARFVSVNAMLTAIDHAARALAPPALAVRPAIRSNLPIQTTSFIGREKEIEEVRALLSASHLLALIGAGGCGKSRLMLKVAESVQEEYRDGVWLVELASISDPALVPRALASVLDAVEQSGKTLLQAVAETIKTRKLLLLLDNCEHLLAACSEAADALLRVCPQIKILVTSREGLGIRGEQTYRVPSLSLPDLKDPVSAVRVLDNESARLFVERATTTRPDFEVTEHNAAALALVCHRLDGIPLAIELAAARARSLSIEEINTRLDNRFRLLTGGSRAALPRQQTLRALIDWSYNLLNIREKTLLLRLSVFAGGWTMEAAEEICDLSSRPDQASDPMIENWEILDLLTALVDKSLVVYQEVEGAGRYRLLETIRQYAQDKLVESADIGDLRDQHRNYYLDLAEAAAAQIQGPDKETGLLRLEAERDNLRAALHWSLETGEQEKGLRLALAGNEFWARFNIYGEAVEWFDRLLLLSTEHSPGPVTIKALCAMGVACWRLGRYGQSRDRIEKAIPMARTLGDEALLRRAVNSLANTLYYQGEFSAARPLYEEGLELARKSGSDRDIGIALNNLGLAENDAGNTEAAQRCFEEALEIRLRIGDHQGRANILNSLGMLALSGGDIEKAERLMLESEALLRPTADRLALSYTLHNLARLRMRQREWDEARRLIIEGLLIKQETGEKWGVAVTLDAMAEWLQARGQNHRACTLSGAAASIHDSIGSHMPPTQQEENEKRLTSLREMLTRPLFDELWAAGSRMTLEQAVSYAVEEPQP